MNPPDLDYLPHGPKDPSRFRIGLIGCGGISPYHLEAAKALGVEVVALADIDGDAARKRRDACCPDAEIYTDHRQLLARDDLHVVEIATHNRVRKEQIRDALEAGKHVLSQKPFTLDLEDGRRLIDLARERNLHLGVNQNGRWSPAFAAVLAGVRSGLLGSIHSLDCVMAWDHTFTRGTPFENLHHLILSDFAIHYFDLAANVFPDRPAKWVFANAVPAPAQDMKPPMLANAVINFGDGLATFAFSAYGTFSEKEFLCCVGSKGTLRALGRINRISEMEYANADGSVTFPLEGSWFTNGFQGTLGEFLSAIEENRESSINAANNLRSLELCFAALQSADTGQPVPLNAV
jgi:predicted dehydrogenase